MKSCDFLNNISDIDNDIIEGAANAGKAKRFPAAKVLTAAACAALCIAAAFGINSKINKKAVSQEAANARYNADDVIVPGGSSDEGSSDEGLYGSENGFQYESSEAAETDKHNVDKSSSEGSCQPLPDGKEASELCETTTKCPVTEKEKNTEDTPVKSADENTDKGIGKSSGSSGIMIPAVPKNNIKVTGEKLTDEEAQSYFKENSVSIISSLSSSGVPADNITISPKGISHLCYDGSTIEYLELRQNFRDYPVWNDGELVAIITLWKEDSKIYNSPAFGAPWFEEYNTFLKAHKGEKLIYVYAGYLELVIAPDNSCTNPMGNDTSYLIQGIKKPYEYFYNEGAVYIP